MRGVSGMGERNGWVGSGILAYSPGAWLLGA